MFKMPFYFTPLFYIFQVKFICTYEFQHGENIIIFFLKSYRSAKWQNRKFSPPPPYPTHINHPIATIIRQPSLGKSDFVGALYPGTTLWNLSGAHDRGGPFWEDRGDPHSHGRFLTTVLVTDPEMGLLPCGLAIPLFGHAPATSHLLRTQEGSHSPIL